MFNQTLNKAPTDSSSNATGLFGGGAPSTSTQSSGGGLFGNPIASQPTTSLFGAPPTASSGLFGATSTPTAAGGGLFGNASTTTTGGLFGNARPTALEGTTPVTAAPPTTSLFNTSSTTTTGGGLFGSTATKPAATSNGTGGGGTQPTPSLFGGFSGGLFGAQNTSSKPAEVSTSLNSQTLGTSQATGGLFGTSSSNTPAGGGLFGSTTAKPAETLSTSGTLNTSQPTSSLFGTSPSVLGTGGLFGGTSALNRPTGTIDATTNQTTSSTSLPQSSLFSSSTAPTGTGLFGSTSSSIKPSGGAADIGSTTQTSELSQPQNSLFGTSSTFGTGGGLFGSASTALKPATPTTETNSGLLSTSQPTGGLFEAPSGSAQSTTEGNLGGGSISLSKTAKETGTGGALNASQTSGSLFGTTPPTGGASTLFGGKTVEGLSTSSAPTSTAAPQSTQSSLFGISTATGSLGGGLFSNAAKPTSASTAAPLPLASSSKQGTDSSVLKDTSSQSVNTQLSTKNFAGTASINKPAENQKSQSHLPVFGGSSISTTNATITATSLAPTNKLESPKGLEASHYERIDDLLRSWEQRTKRQVSGFSRFAEAIMSLDLDLCNSVATLDKLQKAQTRIETRQQEIDLSLDQIEKHQLTLGETLQRLQHVLHSSTDTTVESAPSDRVAEQLQGKLQALSTNLDDSEAAVDELVTDINKIHEALHPGTLGEIIELLNVQQRSISRLYGETQSLREHLGHLDTRLR